MPAYLSLVFITDWIIFQIAILLRYTFFINILKNIMMKIKICLILIMILNLASFSQTAEDRSETNYYNEKIRLWQGVNKVEMFIDTIFTFRNYIENSDKRRIVCNDLIIEKNIDSLIWESKYLANSILSYLNTIDDFALILYNTDRQNNIIASFFICKRESKETVEMMRFQIENKKIIGINILPGIYEGFTPIEEFDNPKWDLFDNH